MDRLSRRTLQCSLTAATRRVLVITRGSRLLAGDTIDFKVAAAAKKGVSDPICVMALNKTDNGAMDLNGTVNVTTKCPAQANSSDSSAVRAVGNARMNTSVFAVTGDVKGKDAFSPMPET